MTNPVYPQQIILYAFILNNSSTKAFKLEFSEVYLRPSFNILNYFITSYIFNFDILQAKQKAAEKKKSGEQKASA